MPAADLTQRPTPRPSIFFAGTATAFKPTAPVGPTDVDGRAGYDRRLQDARCWCAAPPMRKFNGIVVVEWLNVTANAEGAADFMQMQEELLRKGYAWVGVGAQAAGVNSPRSGLKDWDKTRYGSLVHPGDAYSYDIFSQAANALRHPAGVNVLGGLTIARCSRPDDRSRRSGSSPTSTRFIRRPISSTAISCTAAARTRRASRPRGWRATRRTRCRRARTSATDIDVPVLDLQTEGDMVALRAHLTRQAPFAHYRRWEIAGAAHAETPRWVAEVPPPLDMGPGCKDPVNSAPHHAVVKAALERADAVGARRRRAAAVAGDRARSGSGGARSDRPRRARQREGRHPPAGSRSADGDGRRRRQHQGAGTATPGGARNFCFLFGRTRLFDAATLKALYPTHDAFVKPYAAAVDALVKDGYWLAAEGAAAKKAAQESAIGR